MRPEAIKALKTLLSQFHTKEDFYAKIREKTGMRADDYLLKVQAIWAVRSIVNRYDKSLYGEIANKWDEKVVLERYSDSVNKYTSAYGYAKTLKVIRKLQEEGKWTIPEPLKKVHDGNMPLSKEAAAPKAEKLSGIKLVGHLENGKFVPASPDKAIQVLQDVKAPVTEKPKPVEPKPAPFIKTTDDTYEILDFGKRQSHSSLDDYHIRVSVRKGNNYVGINDYISNLCKDFEKVYVYFRVDKITNRLCMVLTPYETPNSISARRKNKTSNTLYLSNKKCAEYLKTRFNLKNDVDEIKVTKNLSKIDNVITIELG